MINLQSWQRELPQGVQSLLSLFLISEVHRRLPMLGIAEGCKVVLGKNSVKFLACVQNAQVAFQSKAEVRDLSVKRSHETHFISSTTHCSSR